MPHFITELNDCSTASWSDDPFRRTKQICEAGPVRPGLVSLNQKYSLDCGVSFDDIKQLWGEATEFFSNILDKN